MEKMLGLTAEIKASIKDRVYDVKNFGPIVDKIFDETDIDHSGYIDKSEMKKLLSKIGKCIECPIPEEEMDDEINKIDTNKDGKISKKEIRPLVKELVLLVLDKY